MVDFVVRQPESGGQEPVPVRFRAGVVGEAMRVVHTGIELPSGDFRTVCGITLEGASAEVVRGGMACMQCMARLALRATQREPELATGDE